MDILRALSSANLDIRRKTLDIILDLVTPTTIAEVMQVRLGCDCVPRQANHRV